MEFMKNPLEFIKMVDSGKRRIEDLPAEQIEVARVTYGLFLDSKLARTNELTGIGNRRAYDEDIGGHLERIGRAVEGDLKRPRDTDVLSVYSGDIDFFKQVNDTLGHDDGDIVLIDTAKILKDGARGAAYRTGGEEFKLILPGTDEYVSWRIAERVRNHIEGFDFLERYKEGKGEALKANMKKRLMRNEMKPENYDLEHAPTMSFGGVTCQALKKGTRFNEPCFRVGGVEVYKIDGVTPIIDRMSDRALYYSKGEESGERDPDTMKIRNRATSAYVPSGNRTGSYGIVVENIMDDVALNKMYEDLAVKRYGEILELDC